MGFELCEHLEGLYETTVMRMKCPNCGNIYYWDNVYAWECTRCNKRYEKTQWERFGIRDDEKNN